MKEQLTEQQIADTAFKAGWIVSMGKSSESAHEVAVIRRKDVDVPEEGIERDSIYPDNYYRYDSTNHDELISWVVQKLNDLGMSLEPAVL